jgi:predicted DsbA family dithiol-disulfide isomerase
VLKVAGDHDRVCGWRLADVVEEVGKPERDLRHREPAAVGDSPGIAAARAGLIVGVKVEIWSDVVCPWCYIGKRRFESALERFEHRAEVEVVWRSFELDPQSPRQRTGDPIGRLADKYRITREEALAMHARVTGVAAEEGLTYRLDAAVSGNTLDAHRLLHLAAERDRQGALKERLLAAYFTEGEAIGLPEVLARLAAEVGIDAAEARAALDGDAYADQVRADEQEAAALGIQGVPFFVLDRRYGVSGAQPAEVLLQALERAWADAHPVMVLTPAGGDAETCEDGSCAI